MREIDVAAIDVYGRLAAGGYLMRILLALDQDGDIMTAMVTNDEDAAGAVDRLHAAGAVRVHHLVADTVDEGIAYVREQTAENWHTTPPTP